MAAALARGLRSNGDEQLDRALEEVVELGPVGDELLVEALQTARGFNRVILVAALGDVDGPAGAAALREALAVTGPGSRDLRSAALLALGKREGARATPEFLAALRGRDGGVREYAVAALAEVGDDRGWDEVIDWLTTRLMTSQRSVWLAGSPILLAISYLVRHAPTGSPRLSRLVRAVRRNWPRLFDDERAWFAAHWLDVVPGGPAPEAVPRPVPQQIHAAASGRLFGLSVDLPSEE